MRKAYVERRKIKYSRKQTYVDIAYKVSEKEQKLDICR